MSNKIVKPLALALGAAFVGSLSLSQQAHASSTFHLNPLLAPFAAAATEGKCGEGKCGMSGMDANKDGKATKEEAMAAGWNETQFGKADAQHQGFLTQASFDAYHLLYKADGSKKGKEGSCSADKKGKEGSCSGH
jgi:uncharacterized low-complexity protein